MILLHLFLVALVQIGPVAAEAQEPRSAPFYADHEKMLVVRDGEGAERPIRSVEDWNVRRAHILSHLQEVMGKLPGGERRVPLDVRVEAAFDELRYLRQKITFATEPGDRVAAWLLLPKGAEGKRPAMLCLHQTTAIGKDEPAGEGGLPNLHYAKELAERGFVTLSPDYPNYGDSHVDVYALGYQSASMKGVWNHMRAVDVLCSLPQVDSGRLGVIGHSLGGHNAIFVALFDERIHALVTSCGFNAFPYYYQGDIAGWSHAGYMPRLRSAYQLDLQKVPFDFPELLGALAPRAVFVNAPLHDENFEVEGVRACFNAAHPVYELFGAAGNLVMQNPDAEHDFPEPVRKRAYEFLADYLKP